MELTAHCDDLNEFDWFVGLHPFFKAARFARILQRGANPAIVDSLIAYDRPDVILVADGRPVLVIEKTREVPTGHNVGQRMARLVRAVESGVPTVKFFPFDARKHGKHSGVCFLNPRILAAFERMWSIHDTPIVAVNWPADSYGELVDDETADSELVELLDGYVATGFDGGCEAMQSARERQALEYRRRCEDDPRYAAPPKSLTIERTSEYLDRLKGEDWSALSERLAEFEETVVYTIGMTEASCRREDPYTGTQFIYDYLYCRSGPSVDEKVRNLVLHFPRIRTAVWAGKNPNDPNRKSCNWYLTATAQVFADGYSLLR
jgi:hypothetical protein